MVNFKDLGLVNTTDLFKKAVEGGYAIPAFNFNNMEQTLSTISTLQIKICRKQIGRSFIILLYENNRIKSVYIKSYPFILFLFIILLITK